MDSQQYDEASVLAHYIWHNYYALLSRQQRYTDHAMQAKLQNEERWKANYLHRVPGQFREAVEKVVETHDWQTFRQEVFQSILKQYDARVVVLRCPQCQRIVRTPKAQQCLWCGHDWHGMSAPLE